MLRPRNQKRRPLLIDLTRNSGREKKKSTYGLAHVREVGGWRDSGRVLSCNTKRPCDHLRSSDLAMARWLLVALMSVMVVSNSLGAADTFTPPPDPAFQPADFTDQSADATFDTGTDNRKDAKDALFASFESPSQVKPPHLTDKDGCTGTRNPCQHGTCENKDGGYTCTCSPGWTGQNCQQDIDECLGNPCQEGRCENKAGGYKCICPFGWTGEHCHQDIDECIWKPCQYGTCVNQDGGYDCTCSPGYTGQNCQQDIDECATNPCKHHGHCENNDGGYTCICSAGQNCQQDIDECATNPCQQGRCENQDGGYTCICSSGWTGNNCQQAQVKDCLEDNGETYRGTVSVTKTGRTCQHWDSQRPHRHRTVANHPSSGLEQNYCRNPDGGPTPWCYTTDPNKKYEFCDVPHCDGKHGCRDGYVYHQPSHLCYKAFNYRTTYNGAVRRCSVDGGTLAMPRDTSTNNFLIDLKNTVDKNAEFRFGLTDRHQKGVWMWDDNVPLGDFRAWGPKQPDNWYKVKGEDCAEYLSESWSSSRKNKWNDGRCTFADRKFICQVSPSGQPREGKLKVQGSGLKAMAGSLGTYYTNFKKGEARQCPSRWREYNNHCYKFMTSRVDWNTAKSRCKASGADLVSIHSREENEFVKRLITNAGSFHLSQAIVYIGLHKKRGRWEWSDGSRLSYSNWAPGEPNHLSFLSLNWSFCSAMYAKTGRLWIFGHHNEKGQWADQQCSGGPGSPYICKAPK
ncbi:hypothetical protein Bbelb_117120 [Branchiostoma belcheri]|nr:hypothetical protein Bbelb_117120 [Branchiostoma belcheri]